MIEEPSYVKDAQKMSDALKIHKVVRKIHKDAIPFLDFYYISADPEPFHGECYRKTEDQILRGHESHQRKMKTNVLSTGSIIIIFLIKNGFYVHHVVSGSMNLCFR